MQDHEATHLPAAARLEGHFFAPGDATVHGHIVGDLIVAGHLELGADARVEGHVRAAAAVLRGQAAGDVSVSGAVELYPGAAVGGLLIADELLTRAGARFEGRVRLGQPADDRRRAAAEPPADPHATQPPPARPHPAAPLAAEVDALFASDDAVTPAPPLWDAPHPATHDDAFSPVPGAAHAGLRLRDRPAG